ncbi:MAG: hypothetical protein Q8P05_05000 [Candidatus Diapherotrites archaeon]|nr:hypothetical protein [Candidatus Diapherotrites archaeon]MDZ4256446.1 hypothetical protein [archaeon]
MPVDVIESYAKFESRFGMDPFFVADSPKGRAIREYFERKGVLQVETMAPGSWPKLIYPSEEKIAARLRELEGEYAKQRRIKGEWEWTRFRTRSHGVVSHVKKVMDPLYWQHVTKTVTDKSYREDAKLIDLHSHLVADVNYRPMIRAFVHNEDYRKQLSETVKTSIVYRDHKGLGKHSKDKRALQLQVSESLLKKTEVHLRELRDQVFVYRQLLSWSREGKE